MLTPEEIGDKVRQLRVKYGKSQKELGRVLGRSHATISDIERGKTGLGVDDLTKVADFFNVPVSEVLGEEPQPETPQLSRSRAVRGMTANEINEAKASFEEFKKIARLRAQD